MAGEAKARRARRHAIVCGRRAGIRITRQYKEDT